MNATRPHWYLVNIGLGNGLVPSGNNPLPEPMLTQIYIVIWRHYAIYIKVWMCNSISQKITIHSLIVDKLCSKKRPQKHKLWPSFVDTIRCFSRSTHEINSRKTPTKIFLCTHCWHGLAHNYVKQCLRDFHKNFKNHTKSYSSMLGVSFAESHAHTIAHK